MPESDLVVEDRALAWAAEVGLTYLLALMVLVGCGTHAMRADAGEAGGGGAAGAATGAGGGGPAGHGGGGGVGSGGDGGNSNGGASGQGGIGCVDIVVSPQALGTADLWGVTPLNGGVWRTGSGLHVGWKAGVGSPSKPWVFVATFDPATGTLQKLRRYDVLPTGVTSSFGDIQGISGTTSDLFAAALRSWDVASQPRNQTLFIGRLDDESFGIEVDLGWPSGSYDVTDVGWDGSAFVVHSRRNSTGEIFLARVNLDGQLILPVTNYGATPSPGGTQLGYRMSTDATSGVSYLFDTPGRGMYLSGHDRSGAALAWSRLSVAIPGISGLEASASAPGVAADPEGGVWVAWSQVGTGAGVAAHVSTVGEIDRSFVFEIIQAFRGTAIAAPSSTRVWFVQKVSGGEIRLYEYDDPILKPGRVLISDPDHGTAIMYTDYMTGLDWQGERWLWFQEARTGTTAVLHIVKVIGDCLYAPATRAVKP